MYTLGDIPRNGATMFRDRVAIVFEEKRYTYLEFNRRVNRCANALKGLGCSKGDRIAIIADNCSKYLEVYFAAAKLGVSVTPVNTRLGDDEIVYIVNDSEAVLFIVGDGYEEHVKRIGDRLAAIRNWVTLDNALRGFQDYEDLIAGASDEEPCVCENDVHENDLAILMYTGGTTGSPKGVMMTHRGSMLSGIATALQSGITKDDSTCFVLPIFHVSWWPILMVLLVGGKVCIVRRPLLNDIFKVIEEEKCTHINLVPTIYGWMVEHPDVNKYNLSSLRIMTYAGSPFPVEVLKRCIEKFGNKFAQGYGSTETSGAPVSMLAAEDHFLNGEKSKYLSSAGYPSICSRVKIVDEEDNSLAAGEVGEICVKGEHIMTGYWKNPELTAKTVRNGWHHMGDMGYLDENGYLFLVDRKADMIITGGENVYPKETEDALYEHPAVMECAVVSAPDEKWGERVHAVVVLKAGAYATEEDLISHCKKRLSGYKCPKKIEFWSELPKSAVGKILRKDVKATLWQGRERPIG